ncbi:MAG: hypothetical protein K0R66_977 [Gammaproteobacteria bacterium]|jgi:hypothetical protein|nr:hypothetical protein [Gammaproteobacteria bacterium]
MNNATPLLQAMRPLPYANLTIRMQSSTVMEITCKNPQEAQFCYSTVVDICDVEIEKGQEPPFEHSLDSGRNTIRVSGNATYCLYRLERHKENFSISYESESAALAHP